jgi:hypothetical protein
MNSLRKRTKFVFCLAIGLVFVSLLYSCASPEPETTPETKRDARAELISSLKGANVDGYTFATEGDEKQEIISLTNSAVKDRIKLNGNTANVVLRYADVKDKKTNSSRTYKIEVAKSGNEIALLQTDVATGQLVTKDRFPAEPHNPTGPTFNSLDECLADFNCRLRPAIQAEANRTCKAQRAGVTCCPPGGGLCTIVDFLITPTRRICGLIGPLDDIEVVSSNP